MFQVISSATQWAAIDSLLMAPGHEVLIETSTDGKTFTPADVCWSEVLG